MLKVGVASFIGALGLLAVLYVFGPEQWIMKYDLYGQPLHVAPRAMAALFYVFFLCFNNGLILILNLLLARESGMKWANIPYKSHWSKPENIAGGVRRLKDLLGLILIFINLVAISTMGLTGFGLMGAWVNVFLFLVLVGVVAVGITVYRLFRP